MGARRVRGGSSSPTTRTSWTPPGPRRRRSGRSAGRTRSPARERSTRSDGSAPYSPAGEQPIQGAQAVPGPHPQVNTSEATTTDGVRLLSHRPSVLYKVEHLATEAPDGDIAVEGLKLAGPGWDDRLKTLLQALSQSERACLFAVRLSDEQALPLPAETLLDRARTDWFPEFLSHGLMRPHFQPIVDISTGRAFGREALMRGKLGAVEVRGAELLAAAEAHDALFSFDSRARAAALEIGVPLMPEGELLFVNLDPRAALDVDSSLRTTWPLVSRLNGDPSRICLEIVRPERCPDRDMLEDLVNA